MFPFNYIPKTIDPKIRKLIISLIIIQFIAFLILIIILIYEHYSKKFGGEETEKIRNQNESNTGNKIKKAKEE